MNPSKRLLGVYEQFNARLQKAPKKLRFTEENEFSKWRDIFLSKIKELLGPMPEPVPLEMEILEEEIIDDFEEFGYPVFKQQKIVYNSEEFASVIAYLLVPTDIKTNEKRPAILNAHGHGMGKAKVVGLDPTYWKSDTPPVEASALQLVKEGFVVLAPDWRPFGQRKLDAHYARPGRDPCNVTYMSFGYFGFNLLALNIFDAMRSIDLLEELPYVDSSKIGMVGKSYGGTMTTYTTALDERIKASVISGYNSTLTDAFSMRGLGNYCGAQYLPGLLEWGDIPDVVGLIAPRPLLIESGEKDSCFIINDTNTAYEQVQKIYKAANAEENLHRDVANVEHEYIFDNLIPFFKKHLN
jgi:Abhydrolase family